MHLLVGTIYHILIIYPKNYVANTAAILLDPYVTIFANGNFHYYAGEFRSEDRHLAICSEYYSNIVSTIICAIFYNVALVQMLRNSIYYLITFTGGSTRSYRISLVLCLQSKKKHTAAEASWSHHRSSSTCKYSIQYGADQMHITCNSAFAQEEMKANVVRISLHIIRVIV